METEISNAKSTVNTTSTRSLTWDDRVRYCEEWRKTGLSKSEFSRRKGLSISLFCKWCNRLWPDETKTNNKQNKVTMWADDWAQLNPPITNTMPNQPTKTPSSIEIKFPNGLLITMSV